MSKTSIMFGLSSELKDAFDVWSQSHNLSSAAAARQALAALIGYDLTSEVKSGPDGRGRPKQYENKAARRAAAKGRRKAKRELAAKLLRDFESEDAKVQRAAFAKAVAAKG